MDCNTGHGNLIKTGMKIEMMGKIGIDTEKCKGCWLCVEACPKNVIIISKDFSKNGYFPAEVVNDNDCFRVRFVCYYVP